ncbi:MAG: hypothetical protein V4541_12335 [Bacteroidota bacterium]
MELLNTRELAYTILISTGLVAGLLIKDLRKDLLSILSALVSKNFLKLYCLFLSYNFLVVFLLKRIGVWEISLLKDTLVWMIFAGLPLVYKAGRAKKIKVYFIELLKSLFALTVLLEFLIGLHTFSLPVELLLAFIMIFLILLIAFAKAREGNEKVVGVLEWTILVVSMAVLLGEFNYVVSHTSEFLKWNYFWQFWLPAELALFLIPFLYAVVTYLRFEETYSMVAKPRFSGPVSRYCRLVLPFYFYNDLDGLRRWRIAAFRSKPKSRFEVIESIKLVKELIKEEKKPQFVNPSEGWSPYMAKAFLMRLGLIGGNYVFYYDNEWGAVSNRKHLSDLDWMANSIDYSVEGNRHIVTQLKLRLEVFDKSKVGDSHAVFLQYVRFLFAIISSEELPVRVVESILFGKKASASVDGFNLIIERILYDNIYGGYNLKFVIKHCKNCLK